MLGWSQEDLAELSGVSVPTIKRVEPGDEPLATSAETLAKLRSAFEAAGIEFTNGGQPGVRMAAQPAAFIIDQPVIVSSSLASVQLRSRSQATSELLMITVDRAAIDDYFTLSDSSIEDRRTIVQANLHAVTRLAADRFAGRIFSRGTVGGVPVVSIVLRLADLQNAELSNPLSKGQ